MGPIFLLTTQNTHALLKVQKILSSNDGDNVFISSLSLGKSPYSHSAFHFYNQIPPKNNNMKCINNKSLHGCNSILVYDFINLLNHHYSGRLSHTCRFPDSFFICHDIVSSDWFIWNNFLAMHCCDSICDIERYRILFSFSFLSEFLCYNCFVSKTFLTMNSGTFVAA